MEKVDEKTVKKPERLKSLDILRGFDMFWIIGGGSLIVALSKIESLHWLIPLAEQMKHPEWIGFTFWDTIFPLFMFISGVTIPYSVLAKREQGVKKSVLQEKIIKRALILFVLGILYNGTFNSTIVNVRISSVLGQIGFAYLIGGSIVLHTKRNSMRALWLLFITLLITSLHLFIPVPGHGAGHFMPDKTFNAWFDQNLLPGRLEPGPYDRLGILCVISASFLVLAGSFAGQLLRNSKTGSHLRKVFILAGTGVMFSAVAIVLNPYYPVIKVIWTMTFNFLTAGISLMLLALFYFIFDVRKCSGKICSGFGFFFKVIGLNSITIYLAARIIPFRSISHFFTGWLVEYTGDWLVVLGIIVAEWLFLYFLYKRKIFLKV